MLRRLLSRIRGTFRRDRQERELDEEVRAHLEMLRDEFVRRGMEPIDAYDAARRQFGGMTELRQDLRESRALPLVDALVGDVRHASRRLLRSKAFTASAALTLALGIGATTAVFAVLYTVVLQPLPYAEPDRLVAFRSLDRRGTPRPTVLSYPDFFDFRRQNRVFERLVCYRDESFTLAESMPAAEVTGEIVSWDLFPLLGIQPVLGRGFRPDEERAGTHVAVLGHALWTRRFNADPAIVGRTIPIGGVAYTVVGVAPAGFRFPVDLPAVQLWVTLAADAGGADQRGGRMLEALGRLRPGVSADEARAQMDVVAGALSQLYPDSNSSVGATSVEPELERVTGQGVRPILVLLGAVALVLLIACANVASLLLARSSERAREFALRTALGASRAALVRQLLVESLALGLLGAAGGLVLAMGALRGLLPLAGDRIPRLAETAVDSRVLAFAAVLALFTSVLFGLAPALQAARVEPASGLKEAGRSIGAGRDGFRSALVVGQIALGLVLLVGAGLLMLGFLHLVRRDPGFRADHLLAFDVGAPDSRRPAEQQIAFSDRLRERVAAIPGVQAVAAGGPLPLQGHEMRIAFDIEERPAPPSQRPRSDAAIVTPGYFITMGIPLLKGRDFSERDDSAAPLVVVVNQAFARRFFAGENPVGKRILPGAGRPPAPPREIVGVVGNAMQAGSGSEADPIYYFPYKQLPWRVGTIVLRTTVPPSQLESAVREAVAALDPLVPVRQVRTGEALAEPIMGPLRFLAALMGGFAGIAVLLTVSGLYGLLSYMVATRRLEIGVRMALGAGRSEVVGMVVRRAALLVAAGLVLGAAGAVAIGRVLASLLQGDPMETPVIVVSACGVMAMTSALAALLPASRAASVDPVGALRTE